MTFTVMKRKSHSYKLSKKWNTPNKFFKDYPENDFLMLTLGANLLVIIALFY